MANFTKRAVLKGGAALTSVALANRASAEDAGNFYARNAIHFLVGIPPGGAYDIIPRIIASRMSRYIPGNPTIVVENMPGASSLIMMNYLANRAPRDGTYIGFPMNSVLLEPSLHLISRSGGVADFDLSHLTWLGSSGQDTTVIWVGASSSFKSFSDLKARPSRLAATTPAADSYLIETLCNKLLGAKISIISGYQGVAQYLVAFERGEVDGSATTYGAISAARPDLIENKKIRILAQFGPERSPELPDVPTGVELAGDADTGKMLRLFGEKFAVAYPVVLGPDIPADRVQALQKAFDATMRDPEVATKLSQLHLSPSKLTREQIAAVVQEMRAAPQNVVDGLKSALAFK